MFSGLFTFIGSLFIIEMLLHTNIVRILSSPKLLISSRRIGFSQLKEVLAENIPKERERIKNFLKSHGSFVVDKVTVDSLYRGLKRVTTLVNEPAVVDEQKGIHFRNLSLRDCQELLPKALNGNVPTPESIFWLMITGKIPTADQVKAVSLELAERAGLPNHVAVLINSLPDSLNPLTQLSAAITALNHDSSFVKAYSKGVNKNDHWKYILDDAMDLIAKLPVIAAYIYAKQFRKGEGTFIVNHEKDWSANFANMMGYNDLGLIECLRLYLTVISDHGGGNVGSHSVHVAGSALSDPFLAYSAGLNSLAGPLSGFACRLVMLFLFKLQKDLGENFTDENLKEYVRKLFKEGQVIPGFGHAALKAIDPRYLCFREYALNHFPDDPLFKLSSRLLGVVPGVLQESGKVTNPWPNFEGLSGVLFNHYGLREIAFYPVLHGVARSLGSMASLVLHSAISLPMERPQSISTERLMKLVEKDA